MVTPMTSTTKIKKFAILIGVTDYGGKDLLFVEKDLELMSAVLKRKGYEVKSLLDEPIRSIFNDDLIKNAADENDVLLVYFSGHGAEVFGEQILIGKGADLKDLKKALDYDENIIALSQLLHVMKSGRALKIIVADCCRTAANAENAVATPKEILDSHRNTFKSIQNCIVAFSSADGEKSTGDVKGSYFTLELVRELKRYRTDFIHMLQAALSSLKAHRRLQSQTPWIYASVASSLIPDQFTFVEKYPEGSRVFVKYADNLGHGVLALYGKRQIVKLVSGQWKSCATIEKLGEIKGAVFSRSQTRVAVFRDKSIGLPVVHPPKDELSMPSIKFVSHTVKNFDRVFGAAFSKCREYIAVYGTCAGSDKSGLVVWKVFAEGKKKILLSRGFKDLQCNAVQWLENGSLVASFSDISGNSTVMEICLINDVCETQAFSLHLDMRVTSIWVEDSLNWTGMQDGSVRRYKYDGTYEVVEYQKQFATQKPGGSSRKGWVSEGDDFFEKSYAVEKMVLLPNLSVLAIRYYDGSVAFLDTILLEYVCNFPPTAYSHNRAFCAGDDDGIFAIRGISEAIFDVHLT
jgi:hypothetical protein